MTLSFMISSRVAFVSLGFILLAKFKWIKIGATGGKVKIFNNVFWNISENIRLQSRLTPQGEKFWILAYSISKRKVYFLL